jgi:MFS transporter, FSR family, fosmidomycin resistance protein
MGMVTLAFAPNFLALLAGAALLGIGSSIFYPESSRLARLASGGAHGFAQSFFQVGGHVGSALGPLLAAFVVLPHGRDSLAWFALVALLGMCILAGVGRWYGRAVSSRATKRGQSTYHNPFSPTQVRRAMAVSIALIFSKFFYLASITSYYTFYLMHRFGLSIETVQIYLFVFLAASAAGLLIGGPIGDRFGRKKVICRRSAVYAGAAVCRANGHPDSQHRHRAGVVVRVLGNRCPRSGADARPGWNGFGAVLWASLRHGRDWRGRLG